MTEEKRPLTEVEKEELRKSIEDSKVKLPKLEFKIEYAKLMIDKGLKANYEEKLDEMKSNLRNKEVEMNFEKKLIEQYEDILAKGEISIEQSEQHSELNSTKEE